MSRLERVLLCASGIIAALCILRVGSPNVRADDAPPDQSRLPVPSESAQKNASRQIKEIFGADNKAKGEALAARTKKMLETANDSHDDPAVKYILTTQAIDDAAGAGDVRTAETAMDALGNAYSVDLQKVRGDAIVSLAKNVRSANDAMLLSELGEATVEQAMAADRYPLARQLATLLISLAKKTGDAASARYAADLTKEIGELESAFGKMKSAETTLEKEPTDPPANLAVGRFRCLMKGEWAKGLPGLARGNDLALKDLALKDISTPSAPSEQMALAGGWYNAAEKETGLAREQLRLRAAEWYERAGPNLTGLTKTMAERRSLEARLEKTAGRWRVSYANRAWSEYLIGLDGTVTVLASSYRETGTKLTARFADGWFWMDIASEGRQERFKRNGSRLSLEHWGKYEYPSVEQSLKAEGIRLDTK